MKKFMKLITVTLCIALAVLATACTPTNLDKTLVKLAKNGYEFECMLLDKEELESFDFDIKGKVYGIEAYKETATTQRYLEIIVCEKISDAKKIFDEEISLSEWDEDTVVKRHGKVIVIANKAGYKDFTK